MLRVDRHQLPTTLPQRLDHERSGRKSMFEILYEASRPGIELPIPPRTPARIPIVDDE